MTATPLAQLRTDQRWLYTVAAVVARVLLAYSGLGGMGGLTEIGTQWTKADYSHGFLVLPFAGYLLWRFRDRMPDPYAAMSPAEFFAELYALVYDLDDPQRAQLPPDVKAWMQAKLGAAARTQPERPKTASSKTAIRRPRR